MGVAQSLSNGVYFIQSVAYNTQVITLTTSGTVVGWKRMHPVDSHQKWRINNITDENGNITGINIMNVATKQYLAMDSTGHKFVVSGNRFQWYTGETGGSKKHYVISSDKGQTAIQLPKPSDGTVMMNTKYNRLPESQHWDLLPVKA